MLQNYAERSYCLTGDDGSESGSYAESARVSRSPASDNTQLHLSFAAAGLALLQPHASSSSNSSSNISSSGSPTLPAGPGPPFSSYFAASAAPAAANTEDAAAAAVEVFRGMLLPMLGLSSLSAHVPALGREMAAVLLHRQLWAFSASLMRSAAEASVAADRPLQDASIQHPQQQRRIYGSVSVPPSTDDVGHLSGTDTAAVELEYLPETVAMQLLEALLQATAAVAMADASTTDSAADLVIQETDSGPDTPTGAPISTLLSATSSPIANSADRKGQAQVSPGVCTTSLNQKLRNDQLSIRRENPESVVSIAPNAAVAQHLPKLESKSSDLLASQAASAALVRGLTALGVKLSLDLTMRLLATGNSSGASGGGRSAAAPVSRATCRRQLRALSSGCLSGAAALGPAMAESAQAALFATFR